jgi:hypothetical protein
VVGKRAAAVAAVVMLGALAVLGVVVVILHGRGQARPVVASTPDRQTQAHQVATALQRLAVDPASLVASGAAPEVVGRARQGVPAGSRVSVDERSWSPDSVGGGTIVVTVIPPGSVAQTYAAVMVSEHGSWKVLATFGITTASASASQAPVTGATP